MFTQNIWSKSTDTNTFCTTTFFGQITSKLVYPPKTEDIFLYKILMLNLYYCICEQVK